MSGLPKANALPAEPITLLIALLNSPTIYEEIANLGDIDGPSSTTAVVDVSAHGNPVRRKIGTLLDAGTVKGPIFFIPGADLEPSHTDPTNGLQAIFERRDLRSYALYYNDDLGTAKFFNAYITSFAEKAPVAGVLTADFELTIDGEILTGTAAGGVATAVFAPPEE